MNKPAKDPKDRFECTGVTVHFIYSFALAKRGPDSLFEPVDLKELFYKGEHCLQKGTPEERRGIKQHLELAEESAWRRLDSFTATILSSEKNDRMKSGVPPPEVEIEPLLRIFRTGATCCFKVTLKRGQRSLIDLTTIHSILGLVQQTEKEPTVFRLKRPHHTQQFTLHSLFVENVQAMAKGNDLAWLDTEDEHVKLSPNPRKESQSPWVVTVAEVQGETATAFCDTFANFKNPADAKAEHVSRFQSEVAGILFRSVKGTNFELEPCYVDTPIPGVADALRNRNLDARLHVTMSNRSVLCICRDQHVIPADYFLPDLLDNCELLRARWHRLTLMNRCLDRVLSNLNDENSTAEQKMRRVVNARTWLARLLEDPELYRVAGDALADISLRLKDVFREAALRRLLLEKADLIERIRAGISELDWLSIKSQYRSSREK